MSHDSLSGISEWEDTSVTDILSIFVGTVTLRTKKLQEEWGLESKTQDFKPWRLGIGKKKLSRLL